MKEREREFQGWVMDVAKAHGWRVWHCPTPMRPIGGSRFMPDPRGAGVPDLIMMHADPPRLIFAELKTEEGQLSEKQREFLRLARGVAEATMVCDSGSSMCESGIDRKIGVYSWRPNHRDLIEAILKSKVTS